MNTSGGCFPLYYLMEVITLAKKKNQAQTTQAAKPAKKKKGKFWQTLVIYMIIAAFLLTGLLSGAAGLGAF